MKKQYIFFQPTFAFVIIYEGLYLEQKIFGHCYTTQFSLLSYNIHYMQNKSKILRKW